MQVRDEFDVTLELYLSLFRGNICCYSISVVKAITAACVIAMAAACAIAMSCTFCNTNKCTILYC